MINYKWKISTLYCVISKDGLNNVVETIHWNYMGTNENGVSCERCGALPVGKPKPEEFVDYENLTLEIVSDWLESNMDIGILQQQIENCISLKENSTHVKLPLPNFSDETESEEKE